jgi:hypothetical protein
MSKAAINIYAVMLSQRLADKNIRVTPVTSRDGTDQNGVI